MTFPAPTFEWVETVDSGVVMTPPDGGAVMRGRTRDADIRVFHLSYTGITTADRDLLVAEFNTAKGRAGETTYTPVGGSSVTVRFMDDELPVRSNGSLWDVECRLREKYTPYT